MNIIKKLKELKEYSITHIPNYPKDATQEELHSQLLVLNHGLREIVNSVEKEGISVYNWIRFEDKYPEFGKEVFVCCKSDSSLHIVKATLDSIENYIDECCSSIYFNWRVSEGDCVFEEVAWCEINAPDDMKTYNKRVDK